MMKKIIRYDLQLFSEIKWLLDAAMLANPKDAHIRSAYYIAHNRCVTLEKATTAFEMLEQAAGRKEVEG